MEQDQRNTKAPFGSQGALPQVRILPCCSACASCLWKSRVPLVSEEQFWYPTMLLRERTFAQASELSGYKKPQYGLKPRHWDSLDTLTSRYYKSHYHFWECCLPIPAKDAEIPLIKLCTFLAMMWIYNTKQLIGMCQADDTNMYRSAYVWWRWLCLILFPNLLSTL